MGCALDALLRVRWPPVERIAKAIRVLRNDFLTVRGVHGVYINCVRVVRPDLFSALTFLDTCDASHLRYVAPQDI